MRNPSSGKARFSSPVSRRDFLRRALLAGLVVPPSIAAVTGCASSSVIGPGPGGSGGPTAGGLRIATPDNPVRWPIYEDNPVIGDGLEPERGGVLQLYNYSDYLAPALIKAFKAKYADYGIDVQLSTFNDLQEAITKIRSGNIAYDLYFTGYDQVSRLVTAKLARPLNHSYLPNITNVWPFFQDPWYDQGWQYTVPYTTYTTGLGWNSELVPDDIGALANPYSALWDPKYQGKTGVLDSFGEVIVQAMLEMGMTDLYTTDQGALDRVSQRLTELNEATSPKVMITQYNDLPLGQLGLSQTWSGDIVNAVAYLPKDKSPQILNYWFPEDGKGLVDNDLMVVLSGGKCPVLAHLFLDFLLEEKNAIRNFHYTGYQPPQNALDPDRLVQEGFIPENLRPATVLPEYFDVGYRLTEQTPAEESAWLAVWQKFKAGS